MRTVHAAALAFAAVVVLAAVPAPVAAHVNHVTADSQATPDGVVVVETTFVASDGFLAVQRDDGGDPGEVIGHTRLHGGEGFRTEVRVPIDDAAWADWNGSATVHLVLRNDHDGDGTFDPDEDTVVTSFGQPAAATVTVARGDRAAVSARDFTPLRAANGSVTVRYAALPADGHLVVENATDGAVLGSVALDAGTHRNVSVPVGDAGTGEETTEVRAAVYRDDGDGTLDAGDSPVRAGDARVATTFSVVPETAPNATATPPLVTTATPFGNDTATASPTDPPTATPGQPGVGVLAGVTAIAALAVFLRRRR